MSEHPSLRLAARADLTAASGLRLLGVVALLLWLAFQWGFGNDALLPTISARAFDAFEDPSVADGVGGDKNWDAGVLAALVAGLAGFVFWTVTQLLDAVVVLMGAQLVPNVIERLGNNLRERGWVKEWHELAWLTRWMIAYGAGASAVCLVDALATGRPGVTGRRWMIVSAALLSSVTVGLLVTAVAAAAVIGLRIEAAQPATEVFIRYAKNPFTWLAIFGLIIVVNIVRNRRSGDQESNDSAGGEVNVLPR